MRLASLVFVFCLMMLFPTHANAYGKRGKGFLGWREKGNTSQSASYGTSTATAFVSPGTGIYVTQSAPAGVTCINGKCYTVPASFNNAWYDPAWKK